MESDEADSDTRIAQNKRSKKPGTNRRVRFELVETELNNIFRTREETGWIKEGQFRRSLSSSEMLEKSAPKQNQVESFSGDLK